MNSGDSVVKRALAEIRQLKARLAEAERGGREPVAIVGMGMRFPGGCESPEAFWDLLENGRCAIGPIPPERWDVDAYYHADPDAPGRMTVREGGFLPDVDAFDAELFGISPREAASMDPQQRMLLEVSWEALEHAGFNPHGLDQSESGVFFGLSNSDYARLALRDVERVDAYSSTGNLLCVAAGRLSYVLGLQGPSLVVDTACSSSLVALHLAVQSLRRSECNLAIAGGVSLMLTPEIHVNFSKARMLSASGRCRSFDASADGYVRSEGCGVVVLKRLSDALRSGDRIWAVVRGSAVNQDGRSGGLTVPNGRAQEAVVRRALADAGIEPASVDYIEAHGTGTSLGDPIEMHALSAVFSPRARPLLVGSVKSNLGHTESAAGIAGVIKTVLAMHHGRVPASLHFERLNPRIELNGAPIEVPASRRDWIPAEGVRRAGVSAFGFSGTNAHVVLEQAPAPEPREGRPEWPAHLLCLSARTPEMLDVLRDRHARFLAEHPETDPADYCFTINAGRAAHAHRLAVIGADTAGLRQALERSESGAASVATGEPRVAFLFPGESAGCSAMGRQLHEAHPVFGKTIDECATALGRIHRADLKTAVFEGAGADVPLAHAAAFAVELGLARLWQAWGVKPAWVSGAGIGGYVAACIAGIWSVDVALELVIRRAAMIAASGDADADSRIASAADQAGFGSMDTGWVCATSGQVLTREQVAGGAYWARAAGAGSGQPANWSAVVEALRAAGCTAIVVVGPRLPECEPAAAAEALACARGIDRQEGEWMGLLRGLRELWTRGATVDWEAFAAPVMPRRIPAPVSVFERGRYWLEGVGPVKSARVADRWEIMVREAAVEARRSIDGRDVAGYGLLWDGLRGIARAAIRQTLHACGLFRSAGERRTAAEVLEDGAFAPNYGKLVRRWLQTLTEAGDLVAEPDGTYRSVEAFDSGPSPEKLLEAAEGLFSNEPGMREYVGACVSALRSVVTGRLSALETLFPGGSFARAEGIYQHSPLARYFHQIAGGVVRGLVSGRGGSLCALEVGGGTGAITASVLNELPAGRTIYHFTDVSKLFLQKTAAKYAAHGFVRYGLFDLERDPAEQGFREESMDLVVASNVLHAVRDLRQALERVRRLLRPGGVLLIHEATRYLAWYDVTVALIEAWDAFDDGIRGVHPLLPPARWEELLLEAGFARATSLPGAGEEGSLLGQHIIVGCAPGITVEASPIPVGQAAAPSSVPVLDTRAKEVDDLRGRLEQASQVERREMLVDVVRTEVAAILQLPPDKRVDRAARLMDLGLDSLMALELRTRLQRAVGVDGLSATMVFDHPTVDAVARYLEGELWEGEAPAAPETAPPDWRAGRGAATAAPSIVERVSGMSEDEAEAELLKRLGV